MLFNFLEIDFVIGNVFIENFEDKLDKNINHIKSILRNQYLIELSTPNIKKPLIHVEDFCFLGACQKYIIPSKYANLNLKGDLH